MSAAFIIFMFGLTVALVCSVIMIILGVCDCPRAAIVCAIIMNIGIATAGIAAGYIIISFLESGTLFFLSSI